MFRDQSEVNFVCLPSGWKNRALLVCFIAVNFDHIVNAISALCEVFILLMIWQDYRRARGKTELYIPRKSWVLMIVLSLIPVGAVIYNRYFLVNVDLREFDAKSDLPLVLSYGGDGGGTACGMTVQGKLLMSRKPNYKLAIGCFVWDGREDILDAPYLQLSNFYDIREGNIQMQAVYSEYFINYRVQIHAAALHVALLNVPNGVQLSQFTTLRQARALGVLIPNVSTQIGQLVTVRPPPQTPQKLTQ